MTSEDAANDVQWVTIFALPHMGPDGTFDIGAESLRIFDASVTHDGRRHSNYGGAMRETQEDQNYAQMFKGLVLNACTYGDRVPRALWLSPLAMVRLISVELGFGLLMRYRVVGKSLVFDLSDPLERGLGELAQILWSRGVRTVRVSHDFVGVALVESGEPMVQERQRDVVGAFSDSRELDSEDVEGHLH